ncbi:site-specific DNA-methyltransferase [Sphingomonadaceae bacterium LXI357]|uniref:site-specific DNA-methyltransferase (adenine-specific) n=2 Tax=Stakelama marina TaxID=2826939 RepID=A0A8T4IFM5_9SPHN|nr:site-specific DNA-methyltransferase [Stakelama marina]
MTRGKDVRAAADVPCRLLEAVPSLDGGDADTGNMLIQGDNLDALKSLLPYYKGAVKCIYIDPPYNTRSAFEHYDDNLEHSQWLAMIYPRLVMLRDLLAEDGSIWVSIDDNEGHYLKVIMDEVFGRRNFISNVIWQKIYTVKNSARHLSEMHDHILVYSKDVDSWSINLLPRSKELNASYTNPDADPRGPWTTNAVQARNFYGAGTYEITSPEGRSFMPPSGTYWRVSKETFDRLNSEGRVWWGRDGSSIPRIKRYLSEVKQGVVPASMWFHSEAGQNAQAKAEVRSLLDDAPVFGTPKPEKLMERILVLASNPGDLVLDSFLGSGTTAAVAHKMGRRWIGIEMGDHAETHCKPRLDKVIAGEQGGVSEAVGWTGGGGYRFYRLGAAVFDADGHIADGIAFATLAAHVWFSETGTPFTGAGDTPMLGMHDGMAYALLYNGILGDRSVSGGNVLTAPLLSRLRDESGWDGPMTVYGEWSKLGAARLKEGGVTFKQTPYDVRAR